MGLPQEMAPGFGSIPPLKKGKPKRTKTNVIDFGSMGLDALKRFYKKLPPGATRNTVRSRMDMMEAKQQEHNAARLPTAEELSSKPNTIRVELTPEELKESSELLDKSIKGSDSPGKTLEKLISMFKK